ncbi:hypothetical protein NA78x_003889 [Anatilimnocola sp. NA78]|uniref:hypothetical protein n=1 Tax=Anatilimnocola sp. NA78 TaxID=3415683 RepID=UPI003CE590D2
MFKYLRQRLGKSAKRSGGMAAQRTRYIGTRLEQLESRSMLSLAPITGDFLVLEQEPKFTDSIVVNRELNSKLQPPEVDLPPFISPPAGDSATMPFPDILPEIPPTEIPGEKQEYIPESPLPEDRSQDDSEPGGLVDLENTFEGSGDSSPADVTTDRETRAVLEMLSALKYPLTGLDRAGTPLLDNLTSDAQTEKQSSENADLKFHEANSEGGAVAIAVREVVAEMEAAKRTVLSSAESLLEVPVQMDNSSGRFQAFEVMTAEDTTSTATSSEVNQDDADSSLQPFSDDFGFFDEDGGDAAMQGEGDESVAGLPVSAEQLTSLEGSFPLSAWIAGRDYTNTAWSVAIALAALGLTHQMLRQRNIERARLQALRVWQQVVKVYLARGIHRSTLG